MYSASPGAPNPISATEVKAVTDSLLEPRFERAVRSFSAHQPMFAMIEHHFGYSEGGRRSGKRIRPQLVLHVADEEGLAPEFALDAASAVEMLHNYSLVHDDIEDGDELRRGRPTVWSRYGLAQGINTGDGMCSISYLTLLANSARFPADRVLAMTRTLHEANYAMCIGQAYDIEFENAAHVSMDDYVMMIDGKTAALFAAACELGAIAAGASRERADAYGAIGRTFGLAFQIVDDVLGIWGSESATGKQVGADLLQHKWSFPIVWALAGPPSPERDLIAERYAQRGRDDRRDIVAITGALDRLDARAAADAACRGRLAEVDRIAVDADIDRSGVIRSFLRTVARA